MHEISLVQGLIDQLTELARDNNRTRVVSITMIIGPLSGVVIDSFRFGFDILAKENDLVRDAELIIEATPVTYRCTSCDTTETTTEPKPDQCRQCGEIFLLAEGGMNWSLKRYQWNNLSLQEDNYV